MSKIMKCKKCDRESSILRAKVWTCPECGTLLDYSQLISLLRELGISPESLNTIENALRSIQVSRAL